MNTNQASAYLTLFLGGAALVIAALILLLSGCAASVTPSDPHAQSAVCDDAGADAPPSLGAVTCVTASGSYSLPCGPRNETPQCLAADLTPGLVADIEWWQTFDPGFCDQCGTGFSAVEPCQTGQTCIVRVRGGSADPTNAVPSRVETGTCR